jgi:glycosyltransferase involved in cell wall biosynthesis
MPVRNARPYLDAAVESILGQSFGNFEFVIRDDGSTDGSTERLRHWAGRDKRIRLFEGERLGPATSSDFVVREAKGAIVARMDADDLSRPDRLLRQMQVLAARPDAVLVGSLCEGIDVADRTVCRPNHPRRKFGAPFGHGTVMFRRNAYDRSGGYRRICDYWEDFDLYVRMARQGRLLVIKEPLYRYRYSQTSGRLTAPRIELEHAIDLMLRCRRLVERGEDYEALLVEERQSARPLDPDVFLMIGYLDVWSGLRPSLLRALIDRGALRFELRTARALLLALWAESSPRSLRLVMRLLIERTAGRGGADEAERDVAEWVLPAPRPLAR